jgi:hypothetical protein
VILITIFMIIVNVQDHADQIQQNTADLQQITKGDILIHHTDHLPTVVNSAVGVEAKENSNRLPFQVCPCPQNLVYHTLQKMSNDKLQYLYISGSRHFPNRKARLLHKMRRAFL